MAPSARKVSATSRAHQSSGQIQHVGQVLAEQSILGTSLADVLRNSGRIAEIAIADIPGLLGELEACRARLWEHLLRGRGQSWDERLPTAPESDKLLSVAEAAQKLGCSQDWVYRHQDQLPIVHVGRHVKLSSVGIDRWIRSRQGRRFDQRQP